MSRPEIIVYRSDGDACFYVSVDGSDLIDPMEGDLWDGRPWYKHSEIPDLIEVWRSGPES